jgi:pyrroloquinoline quinone (PQQ) biosynthesis protein C
MEQKLEKEQQKIKRTQLTLEMKEGLAKAMLQKMVKDFYIHLSNLCKIYSC